MSIYPRKALLKGFDLLNSAEQNHGTSYSLEQRELLGLRGLLPAAVNTMETDKSRALENLRRKDSDIERYVFMQSLMGRNQNLFYRLLIDHIEELMPIVYTPTVGQACREFANIFRQPRGFYISPDDRGDIRKILDNWPKDDVKMIVVTDGERILGLGDLGANGMGIPLGKLALYCACAGIHPHQCMPVMLDVGTDNESLRSNPLYLGYQQPRLRGEAYLALVDEFVMAVQDKFPQALVQFEDFVTANAYKLMNTYRSKVLCFNDDIQGTAAVALGGILAASRFLETSLEDLKILFLGAGSAATGIADLLVIAMQNEGMSASAIAERIWFVDAEGLVTSDRDNLMPHNLPYAKDLPAMSFKDALSTLKPSVLIGATGCGGAFTQDIVEMMSEYNDRPVIFALSNPTSQAECTAEQAYTWSQGRALFASGSPFGPVEWNGSTYTPGQGNNVYIFPGVGLGALISQARVVSDQMFLAAAQTLASSVSPNELEQGVLYPNLKRIRQVSALIAEAVAVCAYEQGLAQAPRPGCLRSYINERMYNPGYWSLYRPD